MSTTNASTDGPALIDFDEGETLFRQDDVAARLFVIREGTVRIEQRVFRETFVVEELGRGNVCGEIAFIENARYPVTAIATGPTRALVVPRSKLDEAVLSDPRVLGVMAQRMTARLTAMQHRLSVFAMRSSEGRIALQLRREAQRLGALAGDVWVPVPFDLPDVLATEKGAVRTTLRTLADAGVIEFDQQGRFRVVDRVGFDRRLAWLELQDRFKSDPS